jgi:tetratricopeptide (TPR) repeat protein
MQQRVGDRFALEREVARGGMGAVFRARDESTGEVVAVKRMLGSSIDRTRFLREATLLSRLSHPRIVRYVAHGEDDDGPWLAMEWIAGPDLSSVIAKRRPTLGHVLDIAAQLAEAVAAAHAIGVVHRDVKPSNVILVRDGGPELRVVDFGVARDMDASAVLTVSGALVGTPLYMSPEQLRGEPATSASDVYAIGCVVFELVAGRPPHVADSPFAAIGRILLDPTPRLERLCPEVPPRFAEVVACALSKEAARRPASSELASLLRGIATDFASAPTLSLAPAWPPVDLTEERRSAAVVVVRRANDRAGVLAAMARVAASSDVLPDGTVLGLFADPSAPDAPLLRAVRFALSLRASHPETVVSIALGRASAASSAVAGEALDRVALVRVETPGIHLDVETARILGDRYTLKVGEVYATVVGEVAFATERLLLGKVTPTVGRDAELAQLLALVDAVADGGAPRVAFIVAPPGQGKSRIRVELRQRFASRTKPVPMLTAGFDPASEGDAWGGLSDCLRYNAGLAAGGTREELRARLADWCAKAALEPSRVAFLAELTGVATQQDVGVLELARGSPRILRDGVHDAMHALLRNLAGDGACALMLEDAHWADRATLALVDDLAARPDLPVALLLFTRPELLDQNPDLCRHRAPLRVDLGAIPPRAATRLARTVLPADTPDAAVQRIVELGAGNPLVTEELIRAYAATGRLTPTPTARAVFEARIGRLAPRERLVARTAATVGEVFWREAVSSLLASTGVEVDAAIETLQREELVAPSTPSRFAGAHEYAFRHALLRDAAAATVADDARVELHAGIARWLLGMNERDHALVAMHAELGGLATLAGEQLEMAGSAAAAALDPATAAELLERALKLLPPGHARRRAAHLALDDVYRETAQPRRRARHLVSFRRMANADPKDWALALCREARMRLDRFELEPAEGRAREAMRLAHEAGADEVFGESVRILVHAYRELGRQDEALSLLVHVARLDAAGATDAPRLSPVLRGELLMLRGTILRRQGQLALAIAAYEKALELYADAGARLLAAETTNGVGYALIVDGQLARARALVRDSIDARRAMGVRRGLAKSMANLGNVRIAVGDWAGAVGPLEEALAMHRDHHDRDGFADTLQLRARVATEQGALADAEGFLSESEALVEASKNLYDRSSAGLVRGWLSLRKRELERSRAAFESTLDVARRIGVMSIAIAASAESARLAMRLGDPTMAVRMAQETLDALARIDASEYAGETFAAVLAVLGAAKHPGLADASSRARRWADGVRGKLGDEELVRAFEERVRGLGIG